MEYKICHNLRYLRETIVAAIQNDEGSMRKLALLFKVSPSFVFELAFRKSKRVTLPQNRSFGDTHRQFRLKVKFSSRN